MKWILCGRHDAATAALEHLVGRGDEVWALGAPGDAEEDGWRRSFAKAARRLGARFDAPRRINAPEVVKELADFGARALVSIQYDQILKQPLFDRLGIPCLNLHFALLPRHRGVAPVAWTILAGDAEAGVTLHHMVAGIDEGDVVAQVRVPVGSETTARELYDALTPAAVSLFVDSYPFSDALLATRRSQDAAGAVYHRVGDFDFSRRGVDWSRPAADLQRWLRAMIFPPMQLPETHLGERSVEIQRVAGEVGARTVAPPGTVLAVEDEGLRVACGDGSLLLRELSVPLDAVRAGDRLS